MTTDDLAGCTDPSEQDTNQKLDELHRLLTTDDQSTSVAVPSVPPTSRGLARVITNAFIRVRNLVVHEFPVLLGAGIAAANAATDQTAKGYAVAAGIGLLRFVVSPHFESAAIREKAVSPELVDAINAALAARGFPPASPTDA